MRPKAIILVLMALLLFPSLLMAGPKTDEPLTGVLGTMTWGIGHEKALDILDKEMMKAYREKAAVMTDHAYADKMRKLTSDRILSARQSYKELNSQNAGIMTVSVVGDEFMPDNNESVFVIRDEVASKYFFFYNDKLYKVVVVYDESYINGRGFDRMVAETADKYGQPFSDDFNDEEAIFVSSTWKDKNGTSMILINKAKTYETFIVVFVQDSMAAALKEKHAGYVKMKNSGPAIDDDINDLTSDDDEAQSASAGNSVDDILGSQTKVDLKAGLSKEDLEEIKSIESGEDFDDDDKKKKKKKRRKHKKKKKKKKGDKGGLVIY